jgi:hypothetical protein
MRAAPSKPADRDEIPGIARSLGFGAMLALWWVLTFELPGRNLFLLAAQRGIERPLAPVTIWAYGLTQQAVGVRGLAVVLIVLAMVLHAWLWRRRARWDVYGRWVFRAGFFVLYVILYGLFLVVFVASELPIWTMPPTQ